MPEKVVLPQAHLIRFAPNGSIQRSLTLDTGYLSFVEIQA